MSMLLVLDDGHGGKAVLLLCRRAESRCLLLCAEMCLSTQMVVVSVMMRMLVNGNAAGGRKLHSNAFTQLCARTTAAMSVVGGVHGRTGTQ